VPETVRGRSEPAGTTSSPALTLSEPRERLSVVLVHYRAPELAADAVAAVLADAARSGFEVEGIVVDNGSDRAGQELLEALPFTRLDPGANLGFAGGVNLGVEHATAATLLVLNPDVEVLPGCLRALASSVRGRPAIAGPRFYWDRGRRFLLPPAEARGRMHEILALLATRSRGAARFARARWRRQARRHWRAGAAIPSHALSGGLLAFSRAAWEQVGPFDSGYRLYFEETDWLRRAELCGVPGYYVPAAEAIHLHGRSAAHEPQAAAWFEESAERYRRLHYGRAFAHLLNLLARGLPKGRGPDPSSPGRSVGEAIGYSFPAWVEVSPNPTGYPAAAELLASPPATWQVPAELRDRLADEAMVARVVDDAGRELGEVDLS